LNQFFLCLAKQWLLFATDHVPFELDRQYLFSHDKKDEWNNDFSQEHDVVYGDKQAHKDLAAALFKDHQRFLACVELG
jgi:hypothetical protein